MPRTRIKYAFKQEGTTLKLYIYDDVTAYGDFNWSTWDYDESETSAQYFREQLEKVKEGDRVELYVNSYGGEVKEGVAIYNQLHRCNAEKVCYIDGFAYSVASLICMACDRIIMGLGTSMLIHEMWTCVAGNAEQLRKEADDLDTLMESNRQIYLKRAKNITEEELIAMMKEETILTPEQCLKYGFCDEITEQVQKNEDDLHQSAEKRLLQLQRQMKNQQYLSQQYCEFMKTAKEPREAEEQENNKCMMLLSAFQKAFGTSQNKEE